MVRICSIDCRRVEKAIRSHRNNSSGKLAEVHITKSHVLYYKYNDSEIQVSLLKPLLVPHVLDPLWEAVKQKDDVETLEIDHMLPIDFVPACEWIGRNLSGLKRLRLSVKHLFGGKSVSTDSQSAFLMPSKCFDDKPVGLVQLKILSIRWVNAESLPDYKIIEWLRNANLQINLTHCVNLESIDIDVMNIEWIAAALPRKPLAASPCKLNISKLIAANEWQIRELIVSVVLKVDRLLIDSFGGLLRNGLTLNQWESDPSSGLVHLIISATRGADFGQIFEMLTSIFGVPGGRWRTLELQITFPHGNKDSFCHNRPLSRYFMLAREQHSQLEQLVARAAGIERLRLVIRYCGHWCSLPYFDSKMILAGNPALSIITSDCMNFNRTSQTLEVANARVAG